MKFFWIVVKQYNLNLILSLKKVKKFLEKLISRKKHYSMIQFFEAWMEANKEKFKYPPEILSRSKKNISLKFQSIIPEIEVWINDYEISVAAVYRKECWDFLRDFDIYVQQDKEGKYSCSECKGEHEKKYDTLKELYEEHTFLEFLKWANKKLWGDQYLALTGAEGYGCAKIIPAEKIAEYSRGKDLIALLRLEEIKR